MAKKLKLSIIIPLFNEEKRLPERFRVAFKKLKNLKSWEIIFVNDGSSDNTLKIIDELSKKYSNIKYISYLKNQGKGYAVARGVKEATGQIIGFMDADFSYSLNQLENVEIEISSGADIVIADRSLINPPNFKKPQFLRALMGRTLSYLNNFFLDLKAIKDTQCGFKFFKNNVAKDLFSKLSLNGWLFDIELLKLALSRKYKIARLAVAWEDVKGSKVNMTYDILPVSRDLIRIYLKFLSLRMIIFLITGLTIIFLIPFFIDPQSLLLRSGDYSDFVWPNFYFVRESFLKFGEIPLWNPTLFSGVPEIANPASPIIYPPNYLIFLLPLNSAILIIIALHVIVGSIFAFLTAKQIFKWDNPAALTLTMAICFSPFVWTKIAVGHLVVAYAILLLAPIIYFSLKFLKKPTALSLFLASIFLSLQYLNHPTHWYYTNFFAAILALYFGIIQRKKRYLFLVLIPLLSILLILPIFLVQLQAGPLISRSQLNLNDLAIPIWSITRFLKSVFIPSNFTGDLEVETWLYPSLSVLFVAALGWFKLKRLYKIPFLVLVGLVVLITLGDRTPVYRLFVQYIPGFSYLRVTTRDWYIFTTLFALLAGWNINRLKGNLKVILSLVIFLDLILFSAGRLWFIPTIMQAKPNKDLESLLISNEGRYYCTSRCLSAAFTVPRGINTADGYHLLILNSYRDAVSAAGGFPSPKYTGNIPSVDDVNAQPSAEKLGKFAVKWVISENNLIDPDFTKVKSAGKYNLYEDVKYLPRIRFKNSDTDKIKILNDEPNRIILSTQGESDTLVVADAFYPGWEAQIDGEKVMIQKEDGWARSISVPSGNHRIEFRFKPLENII